MSNEALDDFLSEVEDYLEGHSDVRDGSDGPRPNEAMNLMVECRGWRETLKKRSSEAPHEVQRDAARYRWLREGRDDQQVCAMRPALDSWGNWKDHPMFEDELDAAIDAAMSASGETGEKP